MVGVFKGTGRVFIIVTAEHSGALHVTQPVDVRPVGQKEMDFALLAVRLVVVRRGLSHIVVVG